ncbi:unnamed protein product [Prunus armeniaca]
MTVVVSVTSHLLGATRGMAPNILNGLINCGLLLLQVLDIKATCLHFSPLGPNLGLLANTLSDLTQLLVSWDLLGAPPAIPINILLQHVPITTMTQNPFLHLLGLNSCSHLTPLGTLTQVPLITWLVVLLTNFLFKMSFVFPLFGPPKDGLYPFSLSSHSSTVPHALTTMHSHAWHRCLGHPSRPVLSHLASSIGFKASTNVSHVPTLPNKMA